MFHRRDDIRLRGFQILSIQAKEDIGCHERGPLQTMAILPAEELEGLRETAHLLRSPRNAARLLTALQRALRGQTRSIALEDLRAELGLDREK